MKYPMSVSGFLAHPDLTKASPNRSSGSYAVLDRIAALQWVRRNIAKSGGDSGNVMVFGHSLASALATGLFQRAVIQSGGMAPGARSIAQLLARAAQEFLRNTAKVRMGPNLDGPVLPPAVRGVFESSQQNDVPLIVGPVADDAPGLGLPTKAAAFAACAKQTFGERAGETLKAVPAAAWHPSIRTGA
jgi:para-nitrobenzyl esterase